MNTINLERAKERAGDMFDLLNEASQLRGDQDDMGVNWLTRVDEVVSYVNPEGKAKERRVRAAQKGWRTRKVRGWPVRKKYKSGKESITI